MKLLIWAILLGLIIPSHGEDMLLPPNHLSCAPDDWTAWYNVDTPTGDGDYESLSLIIQRNPEQMCEQPTDIEGRVMRSQVDAKYSGQALTLNPSVGLICKNEQNLARCQNYEVRFCCPKSRPTCENGKWTNFFSSDTPDDRGDFETLENVLLLLDPSVCKNPTSVDARRISDSLHWSVLGRGRMTNNGFECKNSYPLIPRLAFIPNYRCDDYEVRFCCPNPNLPQCGPEDWTPWLNADDPYDGCDLETLPILSQKYPDVICEFPEAMDARLVESGLHFDRTLPNIEFGKFGLKCCNRFGRRCDDYEVRFCCPKVEPPVECDGKWTRYFDRDNPSGKGDYETLKNLREGYPNEICQHPTAVDAKLVGSDIHYPIPGLTATANTDEGFYCENIDQFERECLDFEVRFCCSEEEPSECDEADWTDFYDIDDPTGLDQCDCEDLPTLIKRHPEVCPNPTAMDVKLKNGADLASVNQLVHLSLTEGFQCHNFEQNTGESCCDYKVRYCCPSGPPPSCDICSEWNGTWTAYFNVDRPVQGSDNCDCELLSTIRENSRDVCEFPIAIDARLFDNRQPQIETQDVDVSLIGGFRCKNTDEQTCKDYKIRFCCPRDLYEIGSLSWCSGAGDLHYTSLDGRRFDFQGTCTYLFVSTTEQAIEYHLYPFVIEVENEHRDRSTAVSYLKKIIVRIETEVIELRKPGLAYVNSALVTLPHEDSFFGYNIQQVGSYLVLTMKFGVVVRYDGNHVISVGVPNNYEGKIEGLCGNYNGNEADDLMIRGSKVFTDDINEFARSYRTNKDCTSLFEEPRECSEEEYDQNSQHCSDIVNNNECLQSCFDQSNSILFYLQDCVFDACAQNNVALALKQTTDRLIEDCFLESFNCTDEGIEECGRTDNCDDNLATCMDTVGTFTCACNAGFTGAGTMGTCTNTDECTMGTDNCDDALATCTDNDGSHTCACNAGYAGDGTMGNCTDLDECTNMNDNCDANAMCMNTVGSFTCTCNAGYTGNGVNCTEPRFRNCHDVARSGFNQSGLYDVIINGTTVTIYCDLQTNVGKWLVIQRREDGSEDFYRNWTEYERGFGNKSGEFWLGLENIHNLTTSLPYELRVDLEDWEGNTAYAVYSVFSVGNASSNYTLNIGGYSGDAGDSMTVYKNLNNQPFSTKDRDNDPWDRVRCAKAWHGGWWYGFGCAWSNLNGRYYGDGRASDDGVHWWSWKSSYSMTRAEMKIRPI